MSNQKTKDKGEDAWLQETEQSKLYGDYLSVVEFEKIGYTPEQIAKTMHTSIDYINHLKATFE